jgi:hypothetical protein
MTTYYYDNEAGVMLAVDEGSNVRVLEPIRKSTDYLIETPPIKETEEKDTRQFSTGCPQLRKSKPT